MFLKKLFHGGAVIKQFFNNAKHFVSIFKVGRE
jgi:hypothetical protein